MASAAQGSIPRPFNGVAFTNAVNAFANELRMLPQLPIVVEGNEATRILSAILGRLDNIDQRLTNVDQRLTNLEHRLSTVEVENRTFREEVRERFERLDASIATSYAYFNRQPLQDLLT